MRRISLTVKAARHELRCAECRVTWSSWLLRIFGCESGFTPGLR